MCACLLMRRGLGPRLPCYSSFNLSSLRQPRRSFTFGSYYACTRPCNFHYLFSKFSSPSCTYIRPSKFSNSISEWKSLFSKDSSDNSSETSKDSTDSGVGNESRSKDRATNENEKEKAQGQSPNQKDKEKQEGSDEQSERHKDEPRRSSPKSDDSAKKSEGGHFPLPFGFQGEGMKLFKVACGFTSYKVHRGKTFLYQ